MIQNFLILFWKALRLSHLFVTGQVFNVNLSYRKTIIITLTTLQLLERESPYVHYCFCFKITDGRELHCISEVKGRREKSEGFLGFLFSDFQFNYFGGKKKLKILDSYPFWHQNKTFLFQLSHLITYYKKYFPWISSLVVFALTVHQCECTSE